MRNKRACPDVGFGQAFLCARAAFDADTAGQCGIGGDEGRIDGRLSALARSNDIPLSGIVNCAPAKGCVWPDIGRHGRGGARGLGGAAMRFYCGDLRSIMSVVRFCWNVLCSVHACHTFLLGGLAFGSRLSLFLCQEKRDSLRYLTFLFHAGRDRL